MTTRQKWSVPIKWESNRLNNFAISSGGVGDALLNSASALAAAGNSLDESIAMITAANTVVQDPQKVGTSMKTISMYLRAAKTDAEAAGESTDGMADSVSKLRAEILQLTGGKVDIQIDENNFKSTYQIMKDLSEVWSSLSDISQANILERIGGKRNANITAALLENFELVDKVIDKTSDSTGSALAENEKYLDSVNGKIAQFKASFEELSTEVLDSDILKLVIDAGSVGLETISAIVGGLKGVAGALTGLGVGLEYIIPLLGLKFFGVFDGIADYATDKLLDIGVVLEKLYNDSGKSIGGIFKKAGSGIKDFLKSGFGKASIAIATISLLVTAFNNLTERTEKAKAKLEETRTELSDTQSKLESLNKELTDTRIRMGELLSMESLTYIEYDELNKLKLSNEELEKEIKLLEAKKKLLKNQETLNFNKVAKSELNSFWESFEGLSFWDFLSGDINYGDTQGDQVKKQIEDYFHNLKAYDYRLSDYTGLSSKYANKTTERDQKAYQKEARQLENEMSDIDESIQNSKAYLEERLISYQSTISGVEYGVNEATDKYLDRYNDLIDSISIALGYDDAEENAFNRLINETFDEATDSFEDLGKEGKVTAKVLEDNIGSGKPLEGFINKLIEIGYISDKERGSLSKVARAFNALGEEARNAGDEVEDAFKRWTDAQNEVQSGAQFDKIIDAINHVYSTVSDKTSDIYGKVGNSDYKAAIDLLIPVDVDIDEKNLSEVSKYLKDNIKKYFTFDDDGNYKGLNVNRFLQESVKANIMEFDENSGLYKLINGVSVEKWAYELKAAVPLIKAMIGEINEYGGNIQILELDKDFETLAKNANSALTSIKDKFEDFDIDFDLSGKTSEEKLKHLDGLINKITEKRSIAGLDTTSYNNLTKMLEYCVKQKQLLEQPSVVYVDTTQLTDESVIASIEKLQKFVNAYHEVELLATLGYDTKSAEEKLNEVIIELGKDSYLKTQIQIDQNSADSVGKQIYSNLDGIIKNFELPKEIFQPALDATSTLANNINEIFNGKRDLVFNIVSQGDGSFKVSVDSTELDDVENDVEETKNKIKKPFLIDMLVSNGVNKSVSLIERLYNFLSNLTSKKHKVDIDVNTNNNSSVYHVGGGEGGGKSFASGNVDRDNIKSLVGEIDEELVVDPENNTWYTVGKSGAEFVDIPKNAIVFNHKQTKSLLKNGHITGRGRAYGGGNAKDAIKDDTGLIDLGSLIKSGSFENKTNNPNSTQTIKIDINQAIGTASAVNPSQSVGSQSSKGSNNSNKNDSKDVIDWVETTLSRLTRSLENFAKTADDTSKSFSTRSKAIDKEISATNSLITANKKAADTYLKAANNVKLSSELKAKVRSGDYSIKEYDSNTAEKINQYKEYYEKYLSAIDEVTAQKLSKAELQMERYALIQQKYDSKFGLQDSKIGYYESLNEQAELDGKSGSIKAQNSLINIQERRKRLLEEERDELEAMFNSGTIKKGTEDWYSMQTAIQDVKADIIATNNEILNLENRKIEIQYERFENIAEGHDNEIALRDNRISLQEANNTRAELEGKGGSVTAQNKIISLNKERADILEQERTELRKQLKNIKEGTPEWYDAKQKIQDINVDLVETENAILEANKTINEIRLERFNSVSDDYAGKHSNTDARIAYYEDLNTRHQLSGNNGSIYAQDKMMEWNAEYINNLKAEEEDLREKLKDINKDTPEYQQALDTLRNHLDKIRDAENQQIEYQNNKRDILLARFNDIQTQYDNKLGDINNELSRVDHDIAMTEAKGYRLTEEHYRRQIEIETKRLDIINEKYAEMKASFENAVSVGNIKEGSLEWYEYKNALDEVEQSAYDTELTITNLNESIKDLEWENFKYLREEISELNDEADFYLDLLSNKDMFDDFGNITEYGTTALGLHGQKYNTYISEASAYSDKLAEIESKLASDPSNQTLIDQKRELKDAIYDNILAAEDEKKAMIDLVEEGINYELDALRKLIDEYETALDKAKDLHDYEKDVADSTSEISSIKKQLSAYSGDDSQESIAKIQKLREDLKKAEEDLEETEYDKYISDQKELLDEFYNEYEENLNARLEDVDSLIVELTGSVNSNASLINNTLSSLAGDFGIVMSKEMTAIWGNDTFGEIMNDYMGNESGIFKGQTSIISVLEMISDKVTNILNNSNDNDSVNTGAFGGSFGDSVSGSNPSEYNIGDELLLSNAVGYNSVGDTNPAAKNLSSYLGKNSYGDELLFPYSVIATEGDWIGIAPSDAYENPLYWIKASDGNIKKFKKGGIVDYTGLAWVDGTKSKPEYMLNAEDTANLMRLTDDLRKLYNIRSNGDSLAKEASDMIRSSGLGSDVLSDINKSVSSATNTIGDINITIPIERVQDYNDFVTQLRDDPKFNKFIKSVSIDLLDGKSRLAKNKINWNK